VTVYQLLVVCTANLLRSPVAEAAFVAWQRRLKLAELEIASAGISALDGEASPTDVIEAVRPFMLDLRSHRARTVSRDDIRASALVLGMTEAHRESLQALVPSATSRIFALREFVRLVDETPKLSEFDGDLGAFAVAVHRERPRRPRPEAAEDVQDAFGESKRRVQACVSNVVELVGQVTARLC